MAESVAPLLLPLHRFVSVTGQPLAGAKLYSYQAGSVIPLALYADADGTAALPNPAVADANGQLVAYVKTDTPYKLDLLDANDVPQPGWPLDNVQQMMLRTGTFTPIAAGLTTAGVGTYQLQFGAYARIGPLLFFRLYLTCLAHTGTGALLIQGLPGSVDFNFGANVMTMWLQATLGAPLAGPLVANMHRDFPVPTVEILTQNLTTGAVLPTVTVATVQTGGPWTLKMNGWYVVV